MAKNQAKKPEATPMDKMMNAGIVVIILIFLGFAVFATYSKISENLEEKAIEAETTAIQNGEAEATVRYMASSAGMDVSEYLEQYGLTLGGDLKETSAVSEMTDMMTVENYYKYLDGDTEEPTDVDELLTQWGADEIGITKDTVWSEAVEKIPFGKYIGDEDYDTMIEQYTEYGYDVSSITKDMSLKEAQDKMQEIISAGPTSTEEPEDAESAE